jgi:hypothetical protein
MMDDDEADNFRRITLMSRVEWAQGLIVQYRKGIDHYRNGSTNTTSGWAVSRNGSVSRRKETTMTIEEMAAEYARMEAHLQWLYEDAVAELTEEIAHEKNPYAREDLVRHLEEVEALHNGTATGRKAAGG